MDKHRLYAGYQASAFILPKGTNNNRIMGREPKTCRAQMGSLHDSSLVPMRPGMVYPVGATFGAVLQIDPVVPCNVVFTLTAPNGTTFATTGNGDQYGYFVAIDRWLLDKARVMDYTRECYLERLPRQSTRHCQRREDGYS